MSYLIYLRKSRKDVELEQYGDEETLARHERILLDLAKTNGYEIGAIYREVVSGETISARPEMQRLFGYRSSPGRYARANKERSAVV